MTPLYYHVQSVLKSYEAQSDPVVESDADRHQTAERLQTFVLIAAIDLSAMLIELQTLDSTTPFFRKRGQHVQRLLQRRQDLASRIAGYWQALDEVCTTFLEHSAADIVSAIFAPLNERMAEFRTRWPQAQPDPLRYPNQRAITVALWHHLAPLPPTTAAQQH